MKENIPIFGVVNYELDKLHSFPILCHQSGFSTMKKKNQTNFIDDIRGIVTVEFVCWVPIYLLIIALIVDVSFLFFGQTGLWSTAHDTSRQMAIGEMTIDQGKQYALSKASFWFDEAEVNIVLSNSTVQVSVTSNAGELTPFGFFGLAPTMILTAQTTHMLEVPQ